MKKTLSMALVFSTIFISCEKVIIPGDYPTTYNKIHPDTLAVMQACYLSGNPYLRTSLNELGFCNG